MNNKLKVIDLVNKIYNNEIRDNTKIKFINEPSATIWEYKTNFNTLSCGIVNKDLLMCLNDEIEIIEEKKIELPEKFEIPEIEHKDNQRILSAEIKINGLIDYLKYKEEEKEK